MTVDEAAGPFLRRRIVLQSPVSATLSTSDHRGMLGSCSSETFQSSPDPAIDSALASSRAA